MFNNVFDKITNNHDDYYPPSLQGSINKINEFIYENINNGVYKCGFATTQEAYEKAYLNLFDALDKTEDILSKNRYLTGFTITEADWRFFTTFNSL